MRSAVEVVVKYRILMISLIVAATGFGTQLAVSSGPRWLFHERERLRLDRLKGEDEGSGDAVPMQSASHRSWVMRLAGLSRALIHLKADRSRLRHK